MMMTSMVTAMMALVMVGLVLVVMIKSEPAGDCECKLVLLVVVLVHHNCDN